ncbi:MAG: metallophosphoesterase family protein [Bacteroidales bacterium]|nr:metallophosphoesterase family protein [Bacteroidales bacterium]
MMKRRSFLKNAAFLTGAAAVAPAVVSCERKASGPDLSIAKDLAFRTDGTFTLLQFTDTHYITGDPRSARALDCVKEALEAVKPDLVIHTGDILFGKPDLDSAREILQPLSDSGIPWAVALGNHDSQFGSTREAVFKLIRAMPGNVNLPPKDGVYGCSNDVITLSGAKGVERVFYLFDSMDAVVLKGEEDIHCYDYIRHNQIAWYRSLSEKFKADNNGTPVPSLAFFHIPLCELQEALSAGVQPLCGNNGEPPCPSRLNSGLFAQFREMGDVQAIVTGHDHDCDYVLQYGGIYFIYGRFSGGDTIYNHLGPQGYIPSDGPTAPGTVSGCRVFKFREGTEGFETCVRLQGGQIQQLLGLKNHQIKRL